MNTPNTPYGSNEQEQALQTQNNNIENNNQTNTSKSKKKFLIAGAAAIATLLGGGSYYLTSQKKEAPKADKIEITAPEKKTSEEGEKTIKFEEAKTDKTPAENTVEKKLTQDEIDAQEAEERGVDLKWWKETKARLEADCQETEDRSREDVFNIPEARSAIAGLIEQHEMLYLPLNPITKKLKVYLDERKKNEEENGRIGYLLGDYSGKE